jgi:hypothetical protein
MALGGAEDGGAAFDSDIVSGDFWEQPVATNSKVIKASNGIDNIMS